MPLNSFTAKELTALRELLSWFRKHQQFDKENEEQAHVDQLNSAYLVYIPAGGLDLVDTDGLGTGTGTADDNFCDSAECQVYTLQDGTLRPVDDFTLIVSNPTSEKVSEGFTLTTQDRFGAWVVGAGGGTKGKLAKSVGAIPVDTGGTAAVYAGVQGSEVATGEELDVFNKFGDVDDDSWLWIEDNGDGWYIVNARCVADGTGT